MTQTEAEAAADAYASNNFFPPDDDRFYSASSVSKKVRGRAKKVPVSSVRPNSVQVDELKRMNAEMKKMLEETINNQNAKPDDPMNEFATSSNPKPPGDGGGPRIKMSIRKNMVKPISENEIQEKDKSRSPPGRKPRRRKDKSKPDEIPITVNPNEETKIRDTSRTPRRKPKEQAKPDDTPVVLKTIDEEELKKMRGRPRKFKSTEEEIKPPKPRGRPKKQKPDEEKFYSMEPEDKKPAAFQKLKPSDGIINLEEDNQKVKRKGRGQGKKKNVEEPEDKKNICV